MSEVQWWLARLDQHGNPTLCDGAHSERAGADRAMYLFKGLGLTKTGERYAVVRVELFEPEPTSAGVDQEAMQIVGSAVRAHRAPEPSALPCHAGEVERG